MSQTSSARVSAPPPYTTNPPQNPATPVQQQQVAVQQAPQNAPQQQLQHYPSLPPQGCTPQPVQPYYCPHPQYLPIPTPIPIYPYPPYFPGPIFYHPSYSQQYPPQYHYQSPQPLQPFPFQTPISPPLPGQQLENSQSMQIIPTPQTGFMYHPPAIIPGIPGVHQYPLIVRKEGEGPPPDPIFVVGDGRSGA